MEIFEALESMRALILECDLPKTTLALFGIRCPYCGKSDRIHRLESPQELAGTLDPAKMKLYSDLWRRLNPSQGKLGICRFCQNPLGLALENATARPLDSL